MFETRFTRLPRDQEPAVEPVELPAVPSARARKILWFEFIVLAEYWLAPLFFGLTNYAGTWSSVGICLFGGFVVSLVVLVLLPLRGRLGRALSNPRRKLLFHGLWAGTFLAGLFVTNTFQVGVVANASGAMALGSTTVYTPFGAWASLTFFVPALRLFGTLNAETVGVLFLLSILGASAILLGTVQRRPRCPVPAPPASRWGPVAARMAVWSPLGLITGCASCAPLYLSGVGLLVPSVAAVGFSDVPLVPWIGLAGLLYLASFGLAIHLIRRSTEEERLSPSDSKG